MTKETQLRILWLVAGGILFCIAASLTLSVYLADRLWVVVLMLAIGATVSLLISRKIAGPFYRIEKDLEAILSGAIKNQQIILREGDPLARLAELVNQLISRINN